MMPTIHITLYLEPDKEETLNLKQLAARLGISYCSMHCRFITYEKDCDLLYYPGHIPRSLIRRKPRKKPVKRVSHRGSVEVSLEETSTDPYMARLFVLRLIEMSKDDYLSSQCPTAKAFLLNEGGMLYFYMELLYSEDLVRTRMKALKEFVKETDRAYSTGLLKLPRRAVLGTGLT